MIDFDKYELLNEMGTGGAAKVFRILEKSTNAVRAMRCIDLSVKEMSAIKQDYYYEHKVLARLESGHHPSIIRSSFIGEDQNSLYMLVDYICGDTIEDYVAKVCHGFVPLSEVLTMSREIASALSYCHVDNASYCYDMSNESCQVIHNDIHARNIMRHHNGHYILMDFDLVLEGTDQPNEIFMDGCKLPLIPKRVGGAPDYKAPEKWSLNMPITPASDIYSFGVLLYFFLTGEVPFPFIAEISNLGLDDTQIEEKLRKAKMPSIFEGRKASFLRNYPEKSYERDYPEWLDVVVAKCLSKMPEDRFANGKELYDFISRNIITEHSESLCVDNASKPQPISTQDNLQASELNLEIVKLRKDNVLLISQLEHKNQELQRKGNKITKIEDELRDFREEYNRQQIYLEQLKSELMTKKSEYPFGVLISCVAMSFIIAVILMFVLYFYIR